MLPVNNIISVHETSGVRMLIAAIGGFIMYH